MVGQQNDKMQFPFFFLALLLARAHTTHTHGERANAELNRGEEEALAIEIF